MAMQKLWARKMKDGAEIAATLFHDRSLKECTCEIAVSGTCAEDTLATSIADAVRAALDARGATPI
jgi:hypothetical protein